MAILFKYGKQIHRFSTSVTNKEEELSFVKIWYTKIHRFLTSVNNKRPVAILIKYGKQIHGILHKKNTQDQKMYKACCHFV